MKLLRRALSLTRQVSDLSKKEYPPPYAMAYASTAPALLTCSFVTYEDEASATNAITEWNGVMYGERKLVCTRSRTPTRAVEKWFPVVDLATGIPRSSLSRFLARLLGLLSDSQYSPSIPASIDWPSRLWSMRDSSRPTSKVSPARAIVSLTC